MRPGARDERGFTVIELAVASAILLVILGAALGEFASSQRHAQDLRSQNELQAEVRETIDRLVPDLRQAYTGDPALPPVASIAPDAITFYSPDRGRPFRLRRIVFRLSGSTLERSATASTNTDGPPWAFGTPGPFVPVARNVQPGTLFTGIDSAGATTSIPAAIRRVGIELTVDVNPARAPLRQTYRTTVEIRITT